MQKLYFLEPDNIQDVVLILNDAGEVEEIKGIEGKKWHCIYSTAFETYPEDYESKI